MKGTDDYRRELLGELSKVMGMTIVNVKRWFNSSNRGWNVEFRVEGLPPLRLPLRTLREPAAVLGAVEDHTGFLFDEEPNWTRVRDLLDILLGDSIAWPEGIL